MKRSFGQFLYYQIFGIEIKPIAIKLDKNESYKTTEHDPLINFIIYLADLFTNYCLPYRLSPVSLAIPGLVLNAIVFLLVYTSAQLERYHYVLWLISRYFTYVFDMIDGKQARRNKSQSLARHYWDHWCDTINVAMSSMILIRIYPEDFKYRIPSTILMSMNPMGFYVNFFRYYCTGQLIEPYTLHLWHYVYVLCLSVPVIVFDTKILTNIDFQVMLATLSAVYTIAYIMKFIDYIISIIKSSLFSIKLFLMIFLSPVIWCSVYLIVTINQSTINCPLESVTFRCLAIFVFCNYAMHVHYQQLINESTHFLTIDSLIFILSLFVLTITDCYYRLVLLIILLTMILSIDFIRVVIRLKTFIDEHPDMGFSLLIVTKNNMKHIDNIINDKSHAHAS